MKAILLCLVVASVFAKPKGYIELADAAKDVAQKETDKAVEEARHANVRQMYCDCNCQCFKKLAEKKKVNYDRGWPPLTSEQGNDMIMRCMKKCSEREKENKKKKQSKCKCKC